MVLLESVPNVSEGRDLAAVAAIAAAFGTASHVLDVHSDADHHRSVVTLVAPEDKLAGALLAGIAQAVELIDLRRHEGVHPRVGAADVVPVVPLTVDDMPRARAVAEEAGRRVGEQLGVPVFLYGASARGLRPAFFRRGGPEELQRRVDAGELRPDFGPSRLHPTAGAVLVGARPVLVAFNVELASGDIEDARAIAACVRESSGGLRGVQALGLSLPRSGRVQVSLNLVDLSHVSLAQVVARIRAEAVRLGVDVGPGELVGLLPESAAAEPGALALAALEDDRILERRIAADIEDVRDPASPMT